MHLDQTLSVKQVRNPLPRAVGSLSLSVKARGQVSCIDRFRPSGSLRATFPRGTDALEAVLVNTAGGLTGGDKFELDAHAGKGSHLVLTTQAAERAYRSAAGSAYVTSRLRIDACAKVSWLPQELIFFDGANLTRCLDIDIAERAELLVAEPVVFGRALMGEVVNEGAFRDCIRISRGGQTLYLDRINLDGNISARLAQAATMSAMTAVANVLYVGPSAEHHLAKARESLLATGGASLIAPGVLAIRLVATDGYMLRAVLCPLLEALSGAELPKSWRL